MHRSKIEWVLNPDNKTLGWVWNPITGCLNHVDGLCKGGGFPCYAYRVAHGRLKQRYITNHNILPAFGSEGAFADPFYPRFWEERLDQIWSLARSKHAKARGIFLCDMSDLFGIGISDEWIKSVLEAVKHASPHRFYLLTKQAARLPQFSPFPDNAWMGVTATNTDMLMNAINCLEEVQAKIKYLSLEPLLSWADTSKWRYPLTDSLKAVNWIIIGACTGTYTDLISLQQRYSALELRRLGPNRYVAFPPPAWVRKIITAADAANIPVFIKDNILNSAQGDYRLTEGRRQFPNK